MIEAVQEYLDRRYSDPNNLVKVKSIKPGPSSGNSVYCFEVVLVAEERPSGAPATNFNLRGAA